MGSMGLYREGEMCIHVYIYIYIQGKMQGAHYPLVKEPAFKHVCNPNTIQDRVLDQGMQQALF